jgi:hypothetical protein
MGHTSEQTGVCTMNRYIYKILIIGFFVIAVIFILPPSVIFSMGQKIEMIPMKPGKLKIRDGEFLQYASYTGGEKVKDVYILSKTRKDNRGPLVDIYLEYKLLSDKKPIPVSFTNYEQKITVSLDKASMVENIKIRATNNISDDINNEIYKHLLINWKDNILYMERWIWNGYETNIIKERVKIKPEYPIWDSLSMIFVGLRFLDIKSPGIIYLVEPIVLKDPIPMNFQIIKKEVLETPAGKFNTLKINAQTSDPFIGKLGKAINDKTFYWVEESERQLIVKFEASGITTYILEKISTYND